MDSPADIRCHELVELVTDYLEGALDDAARTRFELHVVACRGCANYLEQMRATAELVGETPDVEADPEQLDELLEAFRGWHRRTLEES
ncbi:MAG TPA: zf-HC2 domain-containing protein [Solirubrobacteraceae bacterium]|jgi:anti-sigma factor RsiW|nr:zf-HC2 domain-containing protein [Solirubrobacteraceae bacterium]